MDELIELTIKREKLKIKLNEFTKLKDFDGYISQQMKDDINLKIDLEKQERANRKIEEDKKIKDLESIKYKK